MKLKQTIKILSALLVTSILPSKAMACSTDAYLGSMCVFAGNFTIRTWAKAEGQLLSIAQNSALFSLLGTMYGGDGRTTFGLPDLRGRSAIGSGNGPGLPNYNVGQRGGSPTVTLSIANMPSHNHVVTTNVVSTADTSGSSAILRALAGNATTNTPTGNVLANSPRRENIYSSAAPSVDMSTSAVDLTLNIAVDSTATNTVSNNGGSQAFSVQNPYLAVTWLIALQGVYPSRN